jgi:hypothetical protein
MTTKAGAIFSVAAKAGIDLFGDMYPVLKHGAIDRASAMRTENRSATFHRQLPNG